MILAIDPGTKRTGWVFIAEGITSPVIFGISEPDEMRPIIRKYQGQIRAIVIEKPV